MKLATYKDGSRDGQLVVVSRDLSTAHYATGIANRMQQVLDDWNFMSPQLQDLYDALNRVAENSSSVGQARHAFAFDPRQCMAALPRAYQRVDAAIGGNSLVMYPCASDRLLGATDDVPCNSEAAGLDFEASLVVITGDIPSGVSPAQALDGIRLLALVNDVCLREPALTGADSAGAAAQRRLASSFSPVVVTPDECGNAWTKGRLHLTLHSSCNGRKLGMSDAGAQMKFHFGQLIAQVCKYRKLQAGAIIGSGALGQPQTDFMQCGDSMRIEMKGPDGRSLFGAIEQQIAPPAASARS